MIEPRLIIIFFFWLNDCKFEVFEYKDEVYIIVADGYNIVTAFWNWKSFDAYVAAQFPQLY
jgi:hypothetical protein